MDILINNETTDQISEDTIDLIQRAVRGSLGELEIEINVEISVTITDNARIRELNREFREKDAETDVLSFPMFDVGNVLKNSDLKKQQMNEYALPLGDIVISYEKAKEQAEEYGHSIEREIAFLTVHSMLHLLGYDHIDPQEEKEMFFIQEVILRKIGLSREADHV